MGRDRPPKPRADTGEFEQRLRISGLTKYRFSELTGMSRIGVIKWNNSGVPAWAIAWLILYANASKRTSRMLDEWADATPLEIKIKLKE